MHTLKDLIGDIKSLGVLSGNTVLAHSSYKSLGKMERGAETIVKALQNVIGYEGLLLMPAFNMFHERPGAFYRKRGVIYESPTREGSWDIEKSKSTSGWITEYFRNLPETSRSDHYSHSVSAWGRDSISFLSGHRSDEGPKSPWDKDPWGKTYGIDSPFYRAYEKSGKIMMIGSPWESCTYIHFIETLYWKALLDLDRESKYPYLSLKKIGNYYEHRFYKGYLEDHMNIGLVGSATCKVLYIRKFVDYILEEVKKDPERFLKS